MEKERREEQNLTYGHRPREETRKDMLQHQQRFLVLLHEAHHHVCRLHHLFGHLQSLSVADDAKGLRGVWKYYVVW